MVKSVDYSVAIKVKFKTWSRKFYNYVVYLSIVVVVVMYLSLWCVVFVYRWSVRDGISYKNYIWWDFMERSVTSLSASLDTTVLGEDSLSPLWSVYG